MVITKNINKILLIFLVLSSIPNDEMKIKVTHIKGKQTIEGDLTDSMSVQIENQPDRVLVIADDTQYQEVLGNNVYSDGSFIVESSDNDRNCQKTNFRTSLKLTCKGYLKVRKITADDRLEENLPEDNQEDGPEDLREKDNRRERQQENPKENYPGFSGFWRGLFRGLLE